MPYFETTVGADMHLYIDKGAIVLAPLEGVTGITMFLMKPIWGSAVREKDHHLMDRLGVLREIVLETKN